MTSFQVEELDSDCGYIQYGLVQIHSNDRLVIYQGTKVAVLAFLVGVLKPYAIA